MNRGAPRIEDSDSDWDSPSEGGTAQTSHIKKGKLKASDTIEVAQPPTPTKRSINTSGTDGVEVDMEVNPVKFSGDIRTDSPVVLPPPSYEDEIEDSVLQPSPVPPYNFRAGLNADSTSPPNVEVRNSSSRENVYLAHPDVDPVALENERRENQIKTKEKLMQMEVIREKCGDGKYVEVEYIAVSDVYMEPVADRGEYCMRRYLREFATTLGLILSAIVIFVTEILRILLLKVFRPLCGIITFTMRLLVAMWADFTLFFLVHFRRVVEPLIDLMAAIAKRVCVPMLSAFRLVVIDKRRFYGPQEEA